MNFPLLGHSKFVILLSFTTISTDFSHCRLLTKGFRKTQRPRDGGGARGEGGNLDPVGFSPLTSYMLLGNSFNLSATSGKMGITNTEVV